MPSRIVEPREPRIPKESPPFDSSNRWTRTWIMYFESLFGLSVEEAMRQAREAIDAANPLTAKGDLMTFGTAVMRLGVGADGEVLTADSAEAEGIKWAAAASGSGTVTHTGGPLTADQPVFGAGTDDIKVGTKSGNTNQLATVSGSLTSGHALMADASGNVVDSGAAPGTGTVSSVALTVPAEFSVSGSPVTTSGTLAVSKATQSANTVFAGPTTGSAAVPTFRTVVPADLPLASSSAFGAVKVDGTTITASAGVISAAGGSSGALILLEQHTASSSAALNFTAWYSSAYDEYVIEVLNIIPSTNSVSMLMQYSTNGGSSYDSSSSNYEYGQSSMGSTIAGGSLAQGSSSGVSWWNSDQGNGTTMGVCGNGKLYSPGSAYHKPFIYPYFGQNASGNFYGVVVFNRYKITTAVNAFRFIASTGNIASGTVRIYGIVK